MATRVNIVIDQGTDFETSVSLTDATGSQLDLTGMSAAAQIRKHHTSSNSTAFSTALANATGTLTLTLNNSVTSALTLPPLQTDKHLYGILRMQCGKQE